MTRTGLTLDEIPSVIGVPIIRQFSDSRKYLSPAHFYTKRKWNDTYKSCGGYSLRKKYGYKRRTQKLRQIVSKGKVKRRIKRRRFVPGIESVIKNYLTQKGYPYCLPETVAVFSISGIPSDKDLIFDIHCCINQDGVFVIEFRRTKGDAFIITEIFRDLRKLLGSRYDNDESDDEESDDETTLPATGLPVSGKYNIASVAGTSNYKFNFDDLI
jgi:hypothetical protein